MDSEEYLSEIEELFHKRNHNLYEMNENLISEVKFWRKKWFDSVLIPEIYSEDRKKRMAEILLVKPPFKNPDDTKILEDLLLIFRDFPQ